MLKKAYENLRLTKEKCESIYLLLRYFNASCTHICGDIGNSFMLMDDNARSYHVTCAENLESERIRRMKWVAFSSDLNSAKHVWDAIRRHT